MRSLIIGSRKWMMMRLKRKRLWTTVALVGLLAGLCLGTATTPAHAHSDWAALFMGGMMAGRVLSHIQEQRERQAQAMQQTHFRCSDSGCIRLARSNALARPPAPTSGANPF